MTFEAYYGEALPQLKQMEQNLLELLGRYPIQQTLDGVQPVLYCRSRIKEPASMIRKLRSRGLPADSHTALREMHDAVGVRIICSFIDDVYDVSKWLHGREEIPIIEEKDYIAYPKPNGYCSLHLIVESAGRETGGPYGGNPDPNDRIGFLGSTRTSAQIQAENSARKDDWGGSQALCR